MNQKLKRMLFNLQIDTQLNFEDHGVAYPLSGRSFNSENCTKVFCDFEKAANDEALIEAAVNHLEAKHPEYTEHQIADAASDLVIGAALGKACKQTTAILNLLRSLRASTKLATGHKSEADLSAETQLIH